MGASASTIKKQAIICKYNKVKFNDLLNVIRDAHEITNYYANTLIQSESKSRLDNYPNYSDVTEEYFNVTRKETVPELEESYYQFYQYINSLQKMYEDPNLNNEQRNDLLSTVFNKAHIVQKNLIDDLWNTCESQ